MNRNGFLRSTRAPWVSVRSFRSSFSAAFREMSGAGFPASPRSADTSPSTLTSKRSSMSAAARTFWQFLLEETTAVFIFFDLNCRMSRTAAGKTLTRSLSINSW